MRHAVSRRVRAGERRGHRRSFRDRHRLESAIGHGRCTRRFANDPRVQRRSRRTAIPRAPRKNPVAATLGNVTRKGASRDGASGRPRPDRGPTASITTRRVREWVNVTRRSAIVASPAFARVRGGRYAGAPAVDGARKNRRFRCIRGRRDRAGHARLRARRRAAWRGERVLCSVVCLRTSREMSLICGGREGSRSAAGSTGQGRAMPRP